MRTKPTLSVDGARPCIALQSLSSLLVQQSSGIDFSRRQRKSCFYSSGPSSSWAAWIAAFGAGPGPSSTIFHLQNSRSRASLASLSAALTAV